MLMRENHDRHQNIYVKRFKGIHMILYNCDY